MSGPEYQVTEALLDGDDDRWQEAVDYLDLKRGSELMMLALSKACRLQFPTGATVDDIAEYVSHVHAEYPHLQDLKIVPTEFAIRAMLGQPLLVDGLSDDDLLAAQMAVVQVVGQEKNLLGPAREAFIAGVLRALG